MDVNEMIAIFLHIIAHEIKNKVMKRQFSYYGETINQQFHVVLNSVMRLHSMLLRKLEAVTNDCNDDRWK